VSVYVSAYVWENSKHSGTELLLLLAIADIANREGMAWPSVATLGRMIRMSERNTRRALRHLEAAGELKTLRNKGPNGCHLYQVHMIETLPLFNQENLSTGGEDKLSPPPSRGDTQVPQGRTPRSQRGDIAMSAEPSGTNYKAAAAKQAPPAKPVDNSKAAAAAGRKLLYPQRLSSAQQEAMRPYLEAISPREAQNLLDELEGILREKSVRDPMAMFAGLTRQLEAGTFVPSHAHRIQAEREAVHG